MGLFDKWFKKSPVQSMEVAATVHVNPPPVIDNFKTGMWVKTSDGKFGITSNYAEGEFLVVFTDANGFNITVYDEVGKPYNHSHRYPTSQLQRAKLSEIPAWRTSGMSKNELHALGYKD